MTRLSYEVGFFPDHNTQTVHWKCSLIHAWIHLKWLSCVYLVSQYDLKRDKVSNLDIKCGQSDFAVGSQKSF